MFPQGADGGDDLERRRIDNVAAGGRPCQATLQGPTQRAHVVPRHTEYMSGARSVYCGARAAAIKAIFVDDRALLQGLCSNVMVSVTRVLQTRTLQSLSDQETD